MREIKFRAFIIESGFMAYSNYSGDLEDEIIWEITSSGISVSTLDIIDSIGNGEHDQREGYLLQDAELMQFTGLQDKNCIDIYEGDIVHIEKDRFGLGKHEVWTVLYDELYGGYVCFNKLNSKIRIGTSRGYKPTVTCIVNNNYNFDLIVVGNIYENPELLDSGQ